MNARISVTALILFLTCSLTVNGEDWSNEQIANVVNGRLVADWTDPQPELCESGPIGLQLHSNKVAQEVQWRGLILTENPVDQLVTAESHDAGLIVDGTPTEAGLDETSLKKIDTRMQEFVDAKQIAGTVTLVARRGRVVHVGTVGKADVASDRDMATDTVFAIASMTKPITAASVMILNDEGKLKLDDPVSKYIPAFKDTKLAGGKAPAREITIRDCLRHTRWGLGVCLVQKPQGATAMLAPGSFGHGGAFGTQGWIDPKSEMIFVLLIARQNFSGGDASDIRTDFQQLAVDAIRD